jgi:hypothetical protein
MFMTSSDPVLAACDVDPVMVITTSRRRREQATRGHALPRSAAAVGELRPHQSPFRQDRGDIVDAAVATAGSTAVTGGSHGADANADRSG